MTGYSIRSGLHTRYHDRVSRAQSNIAVLAEKPSVARDIARVLGASIKGDGFLHEKHKLISYPRTDSRHLSNDVAETLPRIVKATEARYRAKLAPGTGVSPLGRKFTDDLKVTDHHAII